MKGKSLTAALLFCTAAGALVAAPITEKELKVAACQYAKMQQGVLSFDVPAGKETHTDRTKVYMTVDFAKLKANGKKLVISGEVKMTGVTKPKDVWNGAKVMLTYTTNGKKVYPSFLTGKTFGTADWTKFRKAVQIPADAKTGIVCFGLQDSSGKIQFRNLDLSVE